jgi:hypothetical protein
MTGHINFAFIIPDIIDKVGIVVVYLPQTLLGETG